MSCGGVEEPEGFAALVLPPGATFRQGSLLLQAGAGVPFKTSWVRTSALGSCALLVGLRTVSGHEEPVTAYWSKGEGLPASPVPACSLAGPKGRLPTMVMTHMIVCRRCLRRCPSSLLSFVVMIGTHRFIVVVVVDVSSPLVGFGAA